MSQQTNDAAIGTERASGPGPRLQEARTAHGWSVAEVAERLNLPARHILAIEKGDFARLPEPTYVRGYLRSYALLVGLETREVLEAYERSQHHTRAVAPVEEVEAEAESDELEPVPEADRPRRNLWIPAGAVVVVLLAVAWVFWRPHSHPGAAAAHRASPVAPASGHLPTPAPNYTAAVVPPPNVPAPKQEESPAPVAPAVAPPAAAPPARAPAVASRPRPVTAGHRATVVARPGTTRRPSSGPPFLVGPNQYGHIVLSVASRSRVEIRDATQLVLLNEALPAGQTVTLNGVPPFTVSLTDAAGARLRYNGHALDLGRFMKGKGATVVLGAQGQ